MGGGDLNLKKSWHPNTSKNQEKVWKAEQIDAQEKRKLAELQREITDERNREELKKIGQNSGVLNVNDDKKLEWMYKGSTELVNREEYLLGRTIDKTFEQLDAVEKEQQQQSNVVVPRNHVEHECIPFSIRAFRGVQSAEQVDLTRKLMEDPVMAIKQKEMESRRRILENPVKLKELHRLLKQEGSSSEKREKKSKSKKSKKKKKRSHSDSDTTEDEDLDLLLAKKYKKIQGVINNEDDDDKNLDLNKLLSIKYDKLTKELDKISKKHKKGSDNEDSGKEKRERSESSERDDGRQKQRGSSSEFQRNRNRNMQRRDSASPRRNQRDYNNQRDFNQRDYGQRDYHQRDYNNQRDFNQRDFHQRDFHQRDFNQRDFGQRDYKQNQKNFGQRDFGQRDNRNYNQRGFYNQRNNQNSRMNFNSRMNYNNYNKPRMNFNNRNNYNARYRDTQRDQQRRSSSRSRGRNRSPPDNNQRYRNKDRETDRRDRYSSPGSKRRTRSRSEDKERSVSRESDRNKSRRNRSRSRSNDRPKTSRRSSSSSEDYNKKSRKDSSEDDSSSNNDDDDEQGKKFGLVTADGKKLKIRKRTEEDKDRMKPEKAVKKAWVRPDKVRMTDDEIEQKRQEMLSNANWRDTEREKNVKRYKDEELKEKEKIESSTYDHNFITKELNKAARSETVESRIKSNINNIQRQHSTMDSNFARR